MFHGSAAALTTTLMSCDKLSKLGSMVTQASALRRSPWFRSELIGYVDLTDFHEIWPKCSLVVNAPKCGRLF